MHNCRLWDFRWGSFGFQTRFVGIFFTRFQELRVTSGKVLWEVYRTLTLFVRIFNLWYMSRHNIFDFFTSPRQHYILNTFYFKTLRFHLGQNIAQNICKASSVSTSWSYWRWTGDDNIWFAQFCKAINTNSLKYASRDSVDIFKYSCFYDKIRFPTFRCGCDRGKNASYLSENVVKSSTFLCSSCHVDMAAVPAKLPKFIRTKVIGTLAGIIGYYLHVLAYSDLPRGVLVITITITLCENI